MADGIGGNECSTRKDGQPALPALPPGTSHRRMVVPMQVLDFLLAVIMVMARMIVIVAMACMIVAFVFVITAGMIVVVTIV